MHSGVRFLHLLEISCCCCWLLLLLERRRQQREPAPGGRCLSRAYAWISNSGVVLFPFFLFVELNGFKKMKGLKQPQGGSGLAPRRVQHGFLSSLLLCVWSVLLLLQQQPALVAAARNLIDPMKHDIGVVTQATWSGKVLKFRDTSVFSVLFYRPADKESKALIDGEYDSFAKKMKGIVQVYAVDCDENPKLCKDNNATQLPQIIIFPPFPLPPFPLQVSNSLIS